MTSNPDAIRQVMTLSTSLSDASLTSPAALPALREHLRHYPLADVHVISIGDPPQQRQPSSPSPDGPGRRGHLVRAHTRLQPYGPGRTLRRLRVIPAHWRGNMDDRIDSDRVYSVARTVISTAGQQPPPDTDST